MKRPLIIAHRGASAYAKENTLEAFRLAWQQGADGIEGDFLLTRDKQIICFHDLNGKRLLGKDVSIKSLTLAEVRSLSEALLKPFYIPILSEVLACVPKEKKIFIEVKSGSFIVPYLHEEIKKSKLRPSQIMIISFRKEVIRDHKKGMPEVKACWIRNFRRSRSTSELQPSLKSVVEILKQLGADGLSCNHRYIDKNFVRYFKNLGFETHCWTVDDLQRGQNLIGTGCHSISSNKPPELLVLKTGGQGIL